jgi:hypothetical protein
VVILGAVAGLTPAVLVELLVGVDTREPDTSIVLYSLTFSSKYAPVDPAMRIVTLPPTSTGTDHTADSMASVGVASACASSVIVPSVAVPALIVQSAAVNATWVALKRPQVMTKRLPAATFDVYALVMAVTPSAVAVAISWTGVMPTS